MSFFEGNIVPWLLAAQVVIHNSCTTGLESYILGVPVIAYRPMTSDRFDRTLPNNLSQQAFSLDELQTLVNSSVNGGYQPDLNVLITQKNLIQQYISSLEGTFASEKIVEVLEQFDNKLIEKPARHIPSYLTGKIEAMWRRIKREYNASFNMDRGNRQERYQYLNHIFPDIALRDVESRIENFQRISNASREFTLVRSQKEFLKLSQQIDGPAIGIRTLLDQKGNQYHILSEMPLRST